MVLDDFGSLTVLILLALRFWNHTYGMEYCYTFYLHIPPDPAFKNGLRLVRNISAKRKVLHPVVLWFGSYLDKLSCSLYRQHIVGQSYVLEARINEGDW